MRRGIAQLGLVVLMVNAACSGSDDRIVEREVELLVGEPGRPADIAELRLLARGRQAILFLETGLYDADPRGRRRVVRVLEKIGHREAAPILAHLARTDTDESVRRLAADALVKLGPPPN